MTERLRSHVQASEMRFSRRIQEVTLLNKVRSSEQSWSPRGRDWPRGRPREHILKSLASKLTNPQNCPVLCSRTVLFFDWLKRKITKQKIM